MVPIRHIRTKLCPVCGCATIVSESVEVDMDRQLIRSHCNGGQWERRAFACGYETQFIPNFYTEQKLVNCKNDPEIRKLNEQKKELKQQLLDLIEGSDVPNHVKSSFAESLRYK